METDVQYKLKQTHIDAWQVPPPNDTNARLAAPKWIIEQVMTGTASVGRGGEVYVRYGDTKSEIVQNGDWIIKAGSGLLVMSNEQFRQQYEAAPQAWPEPEPVDIDHPSVQRILTAARDYAAAASDTVVNEAYKRLVTTVRKELGTLRTQRIRDLQGYDK